MSTRRATTYKRFGVPDSSGTRVQTERIEAVRFHQFGYESGYDSDGNVINSVAIVEDRNGDVSMCAADVIRFLDAGKVHFGMDKLNWLADTLATEIDWFMIEHTKGEFTVYTEGRLTSAAWNLIEMLAQEHKVKFIQWGTEST